MEKIKFRAILTPQLEHALYQIKAEPLLISEHNKT